MEAEDYVSRFRASLRSHERQRVEELLELDRFEIVEWLGEGSSGQVYRCRDRVLGREVALKVLRHKHEENPLAQARFKREAKLAASIRHENLISVHDMGKARGCSFIVMDLVLGETLEKAIRRKMEAKALLRLLLGAARGLAEAHQKGIVHRDVKPANILIAEDGSPKVADFGLARDTGAQTQLTWTGAIVGTPSFMAPEQASSNKTSAATDVYALGAILFEVVFGKRLFADHGPSTIYEAIRDNDIRLPSRDAPELFRPLIPVIRKATAKDPNHRYTDASAFAEELESFLRQGIVATKSRAPLLRLSTRTRRLAAIVIVLNICVLVAFLLGKNNRTPEESVASTERVLKSARLVSRADRLIAEARQLRGRIGQEGLERKLRVADNLAQQAIDSFPEHAPAFLARARIAYLRGLSSLGLRHLDQALHFDEKLRPARFERGKILYERAFLLRLGFSPVDTFERERQSLRLIERASFDIVAGAEDEADDADAPSFGNTLKVVFSHIAAKRMEKARAEAMAATKLFSGRKEEAEFFWLLGLISTDDDREWYLQKSVALSPHHPVFRYSLATVLHQRGKQDQAKSHYNLMQKETPHFMGTNLRLALIALDAGRLEEALKTLASIPDDDELAAEREFLRGNVWVARSFREPGQRKAHIRRALRHFEETIKLDSTYVGAYCNRGTAKAELGHPQSAAKDFDHAVSLSPKNPLCRAIRASFLMRHGTKEEAISDLSVAIQIEPDNGRFLTERAMVFAAMGKKDLALRDYDAALDVAPQCVPALIGRGSILLRSGDKSQGMNDLRDAISLDPQAGFALGQHLVALHLGGI